MNRLDTESAIRAALHDRPGRAPCASALPDLLLSTGAMQGPYRPARPLTLSRWARLRRAVRTYLNNRRGPAL